MRIGIVLAPAAALLVAACQLPQGYRHDAVPGVTVVPAPVEGARGTAYRVEGDAGATDDELIRAFLTDVQKRGGDRVSGLTLFEVTGREGDAQTCRRELEPEGIPHTVLEAQLRTQSPQSRMVMKMVTRTEPQTANRCRMVSRTVMRSETDHTQQYDSLSRSYRSVTRTRMVPRQEMQQECRLETTWRTVTRMQPAMESYQPPPRLVWVPVTHIRWKLVPDAPVCEEASGAGPARWVEGMVYVGEVKAD
jgi:hypothetical protein